MATTNWIDGFKEVYDRAVEAWRAGRRSPERLVDAQDAAFLKSIGCTPQELFDFVDDFLLYGEPDYEAVLAVQAVRYDYFQKEMAGQWTGFTASMDDLPPKDEAVDGIAWLPRLIVKARLKLRGEMPPDLMYGCGGDRPFLQSVGITLAEFLILVRDAGDNDRGIVEVVKAERQRVQGRAGGAPATSR